MNTLLKATFPLRDLKYFVIYKPFGVLSQFSEADGHPGLGSIYAFPKDVYAIGRLDRDSEGLLILSNDQKLNHKLLNPKFAHNRTYLTQVEGIPEIKELEAFEKGIVIKVNKKAYHTKPAKVQLIEAPEYLPERTPPIRFRKNKPTSWLALSINEGKNRQVRKMTAKIGYPTLRLVRKSIVGLHLLSYIPGSVQEIDQKDLYKKLNLNFK
ncbi:MAG: pseudouridine synthase [Bacteroidota bacterium]